LTGLARGNFDEISATFRFGIVLGGGPITFAEVCEYVGLSDPSPVCFYLYIGNGALL
jgi:hypothetical protein